jgi:hypothetical protein
MQKFFTALIISITLMATACLHRKSDGKALGESLKNTAIKKDTLAFAYRYIDYRPENCKNSDSCNYLTLSYPDFDSQDSLNYFIKRNILARLSPFNDSNDTIALKDFDKRIKEIVSNNTAEPDTGGIPPQTFELSVNILNQDSDIVLLDFAEGSSGGAHPNSNDYYYNWDRKKSKLISLSDILIDNYDDELTNIAEEIFRTNEGLRKNQPLNHYFFDGGVFALNDNFKITNEGISFFYNSYEIKSYIEGPTDLLIPYKSIKKLLRPNTVITQYLK